MADSPAGRTKHQGIKPLDSFAMGWHAFIVYMNGIDNKGLSNTAIIFPGKPYKILGITMPVEWEREGGREVGYRKIWLYVLINIMNNDNNNNFLLLTFFFFLCEF